MPILGIVASSQQSAFISTNSYESIATVTVGSGGASDITFSSIPSTYTHLQIRGIARGSGDGQLDTTLNSDTGANYSCHSALGYGSGAAPNAESNSSKITMEAYTNATSVFAAYIIDILEYTNTNKYKTTRNLAGYDNNSAGRVSINSGNWRNTNAITSVTLTARSQTFQQYTQFALYGIKGA
jgi:hypothetical protein